MPQVENESGSTTRVFNSHCIRDLFYLRKVVFVLFILACWPLCNTLYWNIFGLFEKWQTYFAAVVWSSRMFICSLFKNEFFRLTNESDDYSCRYLKSTTEKWPRNWTISINICLSTFSQISSNNHSFITQPQSSLSMSDILLMCNNILEGEI